MRTLRPQIVGPSYWVDMERQLRAIFYDLLFRPILLVARAYSVQIPKSLENAKPDALREALRDGRIQYADGVFSGQFSAAISSALRSIGAAFDKARKVYRLNVGSVPPWVRAEAAAYESTSKAAHDAVRRKLDETQQDLTTLVDLIPLDVWKTVGEVEKGFKTSAEQLEITPDLSSASRERLAREYTDNLKPFIKTFADQEIASLRGIVERNAQQGYRFDKLVKGIRTRFGVTANKAAFLARQETSMFVSKFRQLRFREAGVEKYRWSTSRDERVRHDHKRLDKTVWSYDSPPIVDLSTGRKGNPGEDFNCRCVDIPILVESSVEAVA